MRFLFPLIILAAVCTGAAAYAAVDDTYAPQPADADLIKQAKDSIFGQLSDPQSASFRGVFVHIITKADKWAPPFKGSFHYRTVCGQVSAKTQEGVSDFVRFIFVGGDAVIGVTSYDWEINCVN